MHPSVIIPVYDSESDDSEENTDSDLNPTSGTESDIGYPSSVARCRVFTLDLGFFQTSWGISRVNGFLGFFLGYSNFSRVF